MYQPVIGLEIHLQAKTKTKMFCRCKNEPFESEPNSHICPVCYGLPGALPVPNKAAMEACIKLALALNCSINQETKFDRKNYFYPDLPKGYQISQYDQPVGYDGYVEIEVEGDSRRIRIQRVHMEEDTAKSLHGTSGDTLIDFNKSGVPLIEMVTYPDFQSIQEVTAFAKRLRQIVRYIDVSDAEMQKGQMRFELNISVKSDDLPGLPDYKVEVKNIGSISVLEKVIEFETKRQSELKSRGEKIESQTRGLKDMSGETLYQRSKETADDYRYFPEPDIPPIHISDEQIEQLKSQMPELPHQRKARYLALGLELEQADIFVEDKVRGDWFDSFLELNSEKEIVKEAAKWMVGDISFKLQDPTSKVQDINEAIQPDDLLQIINLLKERKISGAAAKDIIAMKFSADKRSVNQIVSEENLIQISDDSKIEKFAQEVIDQNAKVVADIAKNPSAIKFLVGQVMRLSKGKANPHKAEEILRKLLNT